MNNFEYNYGLWACCIICILGGGDINSFFNQPQDKLDYASETMFKAMEKYRKKKQRFTDWIPVKERLPEPNKTILCSQADGNVRTGQYFKHGNKYVFGNYGWEFNVPVIAWCELPEPYEVKK